MQTSAFFHASNETKLMIIACIVGVAFRVTHTTQSSAGLCQFGISCKNKTHTQHSIASDIQLEISWLPSELCKSIDVWIAATWTVGKTAGVLKSTWFPCQKIIIFFLANCYANYWFFCSPGLFVFYATILKQIENFFKFFTVH